jgi:hypothetical protein
MKRLIILAVVAAVTGCVSVPRPGRNSDAPKEDTPADRDAKDAVRQAFDRLHAAWLEGEPIASLGLMSIQGVSDWVLERTRDKSDAEWTKRVATLDAARKVELEHWMRINKNVKVPFVTERSIVLPDSLLGSKWLVDCWKRYIELEKDAQREFAKEIEVSEIYVEGSSASVFVKAGRSPAMMFAMVQEGGKWKYDYDIKPAGRRN